jgi:hypothetical protein
MSEAASNGVRLRARRHYPAECLEGKFSEVREQVDLLNPFLMSTIKEGTTLREAS